MGRGGTVKSDLLSLIDQIEGVRSCFHVIGGKGAPQVKIIYDRLEFVEWKQEMQLELQDIFDRTNDQFIWRTLIILNQRYDGWKDEQYFNELVGSLLAIKKNIEKYYSPDIQSMKMAEEPNDTNQKSPKIFISHSSQDKNYAIYIVDLLEDIGLANDQIFCSSVPGYDIPLDADIYDYLKQQFQKHDLHVILMLSDNYYNSVACMNEMGAAWILQSKCTTLLLPEFEFMEIKGAINPRKIGLKLDGELVDVREKLGQLKDALIQEFQLVKISDHRWERKREEFIQNINGLRAVLNTSMSK